MPKLKQVQLDGQGGDVGQECRGKDFRSNQFWGRDRACVWVECTVYLD